MINNLDWKDAGRLVRMVMESGHIVAGLLRVEEFFNGDDEIPMFSVEVSGKTYQVYDAVSIEFLN